MSNTIKGALEGRHSLARVEHLAEEAAQIDLGAALIAPEPPVSALKPPLISVNPLMTDAKGRRVFRSGTPESMAQALQEATTKRVPPHPLSALDALHTLSHALSTAHFASRKETVAKRAQEVLKIYGKQVGLSDQDIQTAIQSYIPLQYAMAQTRDGRITRGNAAIDALDLGEDTKKRLRLLLSKKEPTQAALKAQGYTENDTQNALDAVERGLNAELDPDHALSMLSDVLGRIPHVKSDQGPLFDRTQTKNHAHINRLLKNHANTLVKHNFPDIKSDDSPRSGSRLSERLQEAQIAALLGIAPKATAGGATGAQFLLGRDGKPLLLYKPSGKQHRGPKTLVAHRLFQSYLPTNFDNFNYAWITESVPAAFAKKTDASAIIPPVEIGQVYRPGQNPLHGTFAFVEPNVQDLAKRTKSGVDEAELVNNLNGLTDQQLTQALGLNLLWGNVDPHSENFLVRNEPEGKSLFLIDSSLSNPTDNFDGHKELALAAGPERTIDQATLRHLVQAFNTDTKKAEFINDVRSYYEQAGYHDTAKLDRMMQALSQRMDYVSWLAEPAQSGITISGAGEVFRRGSGVNFDNYQAKENLIKKRQSDTTQRTLQSAEAVANEANSLLQGLLSLKFKLKIYPNRDPDETLRTLQLLIASLVSAIAEMKTAMRPPINPTALAKAQKDVMAQEKQLDRFADTLAKDGVLLPTQYEALHQLVHKAPPL